MSAGRHHCFRRKNYATFYTSQSSMEREVERCLKKKSLDLCRSNKPDRPEPVLRDMPTAAKARLKKTESAKKKDPDSSESPSPITAKRIRQVRSMLRKNESPRSGLKPAHTLGTRSASDYGLVTVGKLLAEQRKLSDFGLLPPVPLPQSFLSPSALRHTQPSPARRAANMPPRPPKRSLKDRLRNLRLGGDDNNNPAIPSTSHSATSILSTVNTLQTPEEPPTINIRKSISFNEAQISTQKAEKKGKKKMWNRLSIRRPSTAVTTPRSAADAELEEELETKKDVFDFFEKKRSMDATQTLSTDPRNSIGDRSAVRSPRRTISRTASEATDEMLSGSPKGPQNPNIGARRSTLGNNKLLTPVPPAYHPRSASPGRPSCSTSSVNRSSSPAPPHHLHTSSEEGPSTSDAGSGSRSSYELTNDPSKRRTSVFLKRGSLSMDPIKKVELDEVYGVYKQLGTGRFGYIKLAEHKQSGHKIAIKFFPRPAIKQNDFVREYNYSFFLSPHPCIIDTFEGMFQSSDDSAFFFVQELCPSASLRELIEHSVTGLGEENTKKVMLSVLSAVEFMHNENLVHRNLKAENILVFDPKDLSKIKLTDFGLTRKVDTQVKHLEFVTVYHAPELCETVVNEVVSVNKTADVWALGILFYLCTRGRFPWQTATIMCKQYWEWEQWQKRKIPALPKKFTLFSEKGLKLLKKTLCNKPKDRWTAKEIRKCVQKEKLLKPAKESNHDAYVYVPTRSNRVELEEPQKDSNGRVSKRSAIHHWINSTLNTMAEISEQVVSAREL